MKKLFLPQELDSRLSNLSLFYRGINGYIFCENLNNNLIAEALFLTGKCEKGVSHHDPSLIQVKNEFLRKNPEYTSIEMTSQFKDVLYTIYHLNSQINGDDYIILHLTPKSKKVYSNKNIDLEIIQFISDFTIKEGEIHSKLEKIIQENKNIKIIAN